MTAACQSRLLVQPQRKIKLHVGIVGENETNLSLNSVKIAENYNEVKSAYETSAQSGQLSSSWFLLHEATKSIYFFSSLDGMLVHRRATPSIRLTGTNLYMYTWVGRGTVRVKCFAQENNTMSPARARIRTARSGVEHTNHEATASPHKNDNNFITNLGFLM